MPELIDMIRASVWVHPQPELREKEQNKKGDEKLKPQEKRTEKTTKAVKQDKGDE